MESTTPVASAVPVWQLPSYIHGLEQAGFSARAYKLWFQMELAQRGYMAEPDAISHANWPSPIAPSPGDARSGIRQRHLSKSVGEARLSGARGQAEIQNQGLAISPWAMVGDGHIHGGGLRRPHWLRGI